MQTSQGKPEADRKTGLQNTGINKMNEPTKPASPSVDERFLQDVVTGLGKSVKQLPCKYFYDQRGSELFDQITQLDEYYPTRTEHAIIEKYAEEMATQIGSGALLVEFGSGSSVKTRTLLDALSSSMAAYVPVDISEEHLLATASSLREAYPNLEILPLVADFTTAIELPQPASPVSHTAVFFPGSTIGNFTPDAAQKMLARIARIVGRDGGLLIGIDLQKDVETIEAAYNDSEGVTDEFNLNLLHRINEELDGNIDVDQFRHQAVYNQQHGRVELSVVSNKRQEVRIGEHRFQFEENEPILTEYSHKYTIDGFARMAAEVGFELHRSWTDASQLFAVLHLVKVKADAEADRLPGGSR